MPSPKERSHLAGLCAVFLLLTSVGILVAHFDSGLIPRDRLFHSEAIYPIGLSLDAANLRDWNVPFAPYLFPDVFLTLPLVALLKDPTTVVYAFGALQFLLIVFGAGLLFARSARDADAATVRRWTLLAGASLSLALASGLHGRGMLLQLLVAAFHTGAFVLTIYGLILLLKLRESPSRALLAALFALAWIGTFSDPLLFVMFVAPAAAMILWDRRPGAVRAFLAAAAGGVVGLASIPLLNRLDLLRAAEVEPIDRSQAFETLLALPRLEDDVLLFVLDRFFEGLGGLFRVFWFLWLAATIVLACGRPRTEHGRAAFFARFQLLSFAATAAATCFFAVGRYGASSSTHGILFINRYLIGLYALPLLAAGFYLALLVPERRRRTIEIAWMLALALSATLHTPNLGRESFPSWRPPDVACVDREAEARGWKYGLAFFSDARRIQVFNTSDLEMDQVTWDLRPISWIARRTRRGEATGYDFLVTDGLQAALVEEIGAPREEIDCGGLTVRVYDGALPASQVFSPALTPRAVKKTPESKNNPPTGTNNTPSPGSPP